SSGRRVHTCLKQPPAALGTWSSGPGGCDELPRWTLVLSLNPLK
ncbi:hypothetical protein Nmel_010923, partial [Mimus melanotis]